MRLIPALGADFPATAFLPGTVRGGRHHGGMAAGPGRGQSITHLLRAAERGEEVDFGALLPLVYDRLRRIAQVQMGNERQGHTLQATALVHEAFLRLAGAGSLSWKSKGHFYRAAADSMRRILIDHARARNTAKRGGEFQRSAVSLADLVSDASPEEFLAVDDAISRLKEAEPRAGSIAHLRLYAGLSVAETAEALSIPQRTVERDWRYARTWLYERLK